MVSLYFYQKNTINNIETGKYDKNETEALSSFLKVKNLYNKYNIKDIKSFLDNYKLFYENEIEPNIKNITEYDNNHCACSIIHAYIPQYLFICDDKKNILVDDVINVNDINDFLFKKFNIKSTDKLNTQLQSSDNYIKYLSEENIKDIIEIYKVDYQLFFNKNP